MGNRIYQITDIHPTSVWYADREKLIGACIYVPKDGQVRMNLPSKEFGTQDTIYDCKLLLPLDIFGFDLSDFTFCLYPCKVKKLRY